MRTYGAGVNPPQDPGSLHCHLCSGPEQSSQPASGRGVAAGGRARPWSWWLETGSSSHLRPGLWARGRHQVHADGMSSGPELQVRGRVRVYLSGARGGPAETVLTSICCFRTATQESRSFCSLSKASRFET